MAAVTKEEYKWAIYIAISLLMMACSYITLIDQLVLPMYNLQWSDIGWVALIWTLIPAMLCVAQAMVILIAYRPKRSTRQYLNPMDWV